MFRASPPLHSPACSPRFASMMSAQAPAKVADLARP